jgi:hypothetical protein
MIPTDDVKRFDNFVQTLHTGFHDDHRRSPNAVRGPE